MDEVRLEFDSSQLEGLLKRAPDLVARRIEAFVSAWVSQLLGEVKERTSTHSGLLRQSIIGDVRVLRGGIGVSAVADQARPVGGLGVEGRVSSSQPYAVPVELGTQPHPVSEKGREALALWAREKLGVSEQDAERVAFLIAQKIRREGTEGHFMFRDTMDANRPAIAEDFRALVAELARDIENGRG